MTYAYDKLYLNPARAALGRMLDFAVYDLGYRLADFFDLFLASGMARRFGEGDHTILVGRSGVELAYMVVEKAEGRPCTVKPRYTAGRSAEYWLGWALAYYQWERVIPFSELARYVPAEDLRALYWPYHEMDIRHFVDKVDELYRKAAPATRLKYYRKLAGLSQRQLAVRAGIPVRTIQQYEQRQKDINKAQAGYLAALARVLGCGAADLMEWAREKEAVI